MKKQILKYTLITLFVGSLTFSCSTKKKEDVSIAKKETTTEKKQAWTNEQIESFKLNSNLFLKAHTVENPDKYTNCILKITMEKYPDAEDALSSSQNEMLVLFEKSDCLDNLLLVKIESAWNKETEALFLKNCITSAKKNTMTDKDAKDYCDCALTKVKKIIPNPQYAIKLTEEEYKSVLEDCKK